MSLRMKASQAFKLRGKQINAGEVFPVKDSDVATIQRWKFGELVDGQAQAETPEAKAPPAGKPAAKDKAAGKADSEKPLASHTIAELKAVAATHGIDVPSSANKGEILNKIRRSPKYLRRDMQAEK